MDKDEKIRRLEAAVNVAIDYLVLCEEVTRRNPKFCITLSLEALGYIRNKIEAELDGSS